MRCMKAIKYNFNLFYEIFIFLCLEKYKCGPILRKIWECDHFFPKDLKMKWKVIVRNMTAINGLNYRR